MVKQFGTKISGLAHRMIQNRDIAQEASQEVWYEVLKNIDQFKGNSDISTWIFVIARRTILRYAGLERTYNEKELSGYFEFEPIEYDGNEDDKRQWVKEKCDYCITALFHCLNADSRLIYLFRDIAGLSYAQISIIMGTSEMNVRQIVSRSREKIRNFMNKRCVLYNPTGDCRCRIRKHVVAVDLGGTYSKLSKAAKLADWFQKFDKELPRKNYWEKFVSEDVTG